MELNSEQQAALKILESGQNVFLTGKAGVGKSTLLREFLARAKAAKKKCVVCAPTGLAALNIDGITLHRCFNIKIGPLGPDEPREEWFQPSDILQQADVIVIDEISMCRFDAFSYVCRYLTLLKRKIQVVLVGDFFQLPPVIREDDASALKRLWDNGEIGEGFAFLSHYWSELNLITINLQQVMRQSDVDFINVLNSIRSNSGGDADVLAWLKENSEKNKAENPALYADAVRIVPYKKTAEAINRKKLAEIKGKEYVYEGQVIDDFTVSDAPVEQTLSLKAGARVMALANDPEGRYVNGSTGVVIRCNKKSKTILVRFDNGNRVGVSPYTWKKFQYEIDAANNFTKKAVGSFVQFPLRLAYAITIHKSQGQTFESVVLQPGMFANGQLYVALSRCKSRNGFFIDGEIAKKDWKTSSAVRNFYKKIDREILEIPFKGNELEYLLKYAKEDKKTAEDFIRDVVIRYMRKRYVKALRAVS